MDKGYTIKNVLGDNIGYVRYDFHYGSDSDIPRIARVSTGSQNKGEEKDKGLLRYLYKNSHSSPMEFAGINFKLKCPLFVRDQLVRHRCGKFNIHSLRYSEIEDQFYIPQKWRKQAKKNKQSSEDTDELDYESLSFSLEDFCNESFNLYKTYLNEDVSREMARMVLSTNVYTEMFVMFDLNNLMKFLKLRMDSHAQWEIQQYANAMYQIFEELFPWVAEAFNRYKIEVRDTLDET